MNHTTSPFVSEEEIERDYGYTGETSRPALRLLQSDEGPEEERSLWSSENLDEDEDSDNRGSHNPDVTEEMDEAGGDDYFDEAELDVWVEAEQETPAPPKSKEIVRATRWKWRNKVDRAVRTQYKLKGSSLQKRVRYYSKEKFAEKFPKSSIRPVLLKLLLVPNLSASKILFDHGKFAISHDSSGVTPKQRVRAVEKLVDERIKADSFFIDGFRTNTITPRELIADFIQGVTTSRTARSKRRVIMQLPNTVDTLTHEACHFYAHSRFNSLAAKRSTGKFLGGLRIADILYEGFAEYFAGQVMRDHAKILGPAGPTAYEAYARAAARIIATTGERTGRNAYFGGNRKALARLFKAVDANIKYYPLMVPGFVIDKELGAENEFEGSELEGFESENGFELESEYEDDEFEGNEFEDDEFEGDHYKDDEFDDDIEQESDEFGHDPHHGYSDHEYANELVGGFDERERWDSDEYESEADDPDFEGSVFAREDIENDSNTQDSFEVIGEAFEHPEHQYERDSNGSAFNPDDEVTAELTESEADDLIESETGSRRRKYDRMLKIALRNLEPAGFNAPWKKPTATRPSTGKYDTKYWRIVNDPKPGSYLDKNKKWRRHNWDKLEIKDDKKAFEAVRSLLRREKHWTFECASFVQAVHLYALARSRGRQRFLRYFRTKKLNLRYHWSPGLITLQNHRKDAPNKHWRVTTPAGKSTDTISAKDLLKQTPFGARVMWHNVKGEGAWKNENTVKVGNDRYRGFPLYRSQPVKGWKIQMGLAAHQVYKNDRARLRSILGEIHKASGTDVVNNANLQSLWQYTKKNVYLREVQTIGPDPAM